MNSGKPQNYILTWVEKQQSKGRYFFSLLELHAQFPAISRRGMTQAINRLKKKNKITSVYKGYYVVVPPEYSVRGILPPYMYIDALMKSLGKQYYVGLLNAAALYGSSHQQPQEYFVCTIPPAHRENTKKGIRINFFTKNTIPDQLLELKKNEMGYFKVSSPELTAADIIQFEKRIGGLNRAVTVLNELLDSIQIQRITAKFVQAVPAATLQRLGFILEYILHRQKMADALFETSKNAGLNFFRIALKQGRSVKGYRSENRWKVVSNISLELEE